MAVQYVLLLYIKYTRVCVGMQVCLLTCSESACRDFQWGLGNGICARHDHWQAAGGLQRDKARRDVGDRRQGAHYIVQLRE